mmetsp:Transcript_39806/g.80432  ORF Transcript_39806/g.80432 Transcript_39806/m.80432 type:complete len:216 (-) Transcript_39806:379-1026(-)|eukprot:CAMPEP_0113818148 /NCGR_PEP_ID=MMETSP0328-20130328/95_1 /TAXON_ID=39455 /ORGANISM="Alexandrium minutum" /LENGTH=215 /DNA_ID=CAMNT_0000786083 /DNA_START=180 /DNA_END=827 /DNA_ORIENTATION=- /assembly_acc=CAM_ASM_000350
MAAGEADEPLRGAGFFPTGEALSDEGGDEDGSRGPPPCAVLARGGGHNLLHLGDRAPPILLWTSDRDAGCGVGFVCAYAVMKGVFYAQMAVEGGAGYCDEAQATQKAVAEQSMKGAITTLLDVAEALMAQKIVLGLSQAHAACAELVCSLLYLGFEVAPSRTRKTPLVGAALQLDLDIGLPSRAMPPSSEHTCTGTSDCSTSAEDGELEEGTDSD